MKESPLSKVIEKFRRNKQAKTALGHQMLSSDLIGIINQTLSSFRFEQQIRLGSSLEGSRNHIAV